MTVAPHAGIVDFGTFTSPTSSVDGIQGEVPQPLAGQQNYVLTANGWVALSSLGTLVFQGTWDASTNTPTLVSSVGVQGYYYVVSVAGNTDLNGITTWTEGDWAIFSGSVWQKIEGGSTVNITGGTINNTVIGNTTPAAGTFTTITGQTGRLNGTGSNLLLQSSSLTTTWTQSNISLTGGQADPFGGTTAAILNSGTAASAQHSFFQSTAYSLNTFTLSIYAKAGTANFVGIYLSNPNSGVIFNLSTGSFSTNIGTAPASFAITAVSGAAGWYRCSITVSGVQNFSQFFISEDGINLTFTGTSKTIIVAAPQLEIGSTLNAYVPTTSAIVYGTPTLSFSGVSTLGLESNGALFLQPAGTGALQAQATTSTTAGGNVRGTQAVDWQMARGTAGQVATGTYSNIGGGFGNLVSGFASSIAGGYDNNPAGSFSGVAGGRANLISSNAAYSFVGGGRSNTASGVYNFMGGGFTNSGTANTAVTTQSATMNATTAVTLSGSNANIKIGQYITGTSIGDDTYVAAISGTSLTLSKNASGSSTSTLSFFTPHGVVVGGGNNQATGSYSFIGGGGDAGTAANRNVASGLYGTIVGGRGNTASGIGSFVGGGGVFLDTVTNIYPNTASGGGSAILGGLSNTASGSYSTVLGGLNNTANSAGSIALGQLATTRSIVGNLSFSSCEGAVAFALGVSQTSILTLGRQTTDATPTALTSTSSAAGTTNQVILPNNSAYTFNGTMIANVTGGGDTSSWEFRGAIKRGANAASTVLVGTPKIDNIGYDAGAVLWTFTLTADTTNGGLRVTVTGQAATTIRWVAKIETTEVTF